METLVEKTQREVRIARLELELEQVRKECDELKDANALLTKRVEDAFRESIPPLQEKVAALKAENDMLVRQANAALKTVREREDRIDELNVEITRLAHPELFNADGTRKGV